MACEAGAVNQMVTRKAAKEPAPGSVEARAKHAEAAFRERNPKEARSLPKPDIFPEGVRPSRDEKLRRSRPGRYSPAGFEPAPIAYVEHEGEITFFEHADDPDFIGDRATWLEEQGASASYEKVSHDLASKAQALRGLFDIVPAIEVAFTNTFVHMGVRRAIEAASAELDSIWVALLLDLVADAVRRQLEDEAAKRSRAVGMRNEVTPASADRALALRGRTMLATDILDALREALVPFSGVASLPSYVTPAVVKWTLSHFAEGRGGGRPGIIRKTKLSRAKLSKLLKNEAELARAMRRG